MVLGHRSGGECWSEPECREECETVSEQQCEEREQQCVTVMENQCSGLTCADAQCGYIYDNK